MAPGDRDRRLRLATGITTVVRERAGARRTPPVVLVHSWAASRRSFAVLQPLLSLHVHTLAPDLRGHGDADKPPTGYDLATLAGDVVALLDAVEVPRAILLGASSGGYVAQQVAVSAPDRVAALVLSGAPRDLRGRPPFADEVERLRDPVDREWVRRFLAGLTDLDRLPSWYGELMVDDALRLPAAVWLATFQGLIASLPPTEVGTITAPTLVISGGRDALLPRDETAALVGAIRGAEWIEYPGVGHLVVEEEPAALAADAAAFVAELPGEDPP